MTDDLTTLPGIGPAIAEELRAAGFETADDVRSASVEELCRVGMIGESTARSLLSDVGLGQGRGKPPSVEEHIDEIMEIAERPVSDRGVIRLSPISWSTHKEWRNHDGEPYETYQRRWERHRGEAEVKLAEEVARNDPRFLLERAFGYTKEQSIDVNETVEVTELSEDEKEQLSETFNRKPQT